jgi:leukotriene-A4 hydrolase
MEHPMITFASPTLISGDKSQVNVAFHELTHSWFGNNVGCQNWDNFWLNEGLNTFMERKVTSIIYGVNFTKIEYFTGNTTMYEDMLDYGLDNLYSSLFPNIRMDDPENSFSNIIYEKGSQFVYYIESLIGEDKMQVLLRLYINAFAQSAIESTDFKALYETFVMDNFDTNTSSDVILKTDWDTWIYKPGLPPVLQDFTTDELAEALALAQSYAELGGQSSPANFQDFFVFFTSQKIAFIDELNYIDSVDADLLAYIDSDLNLLSITSPPVKNKWYELGISKGYDAVMDPTYTWMGEQGRNKYVIPIFQSLVDAGHCDMGKAWFEDYQSFYNSYVVSGVERILKPCDVVVAPIPMPSLSPNAMPATTPTSSAGGSAAISAVWSATMIVLLIICINS